MRGSFSTLPCCLTECVLSDIAENAVSFSCQQVIGNNGFGGADLFVCYKKKDGSWSKRANLGNSINIWGLERFLFVSPDGKYLFFLRVTESSDIYWVDTKIIDDLKPEELR